MMRHLDKIKKAAYTLGLALLPVVSYAQAGDHTPLRISDMHVEAVGDSVDIDLTVSVGSLRMSRQDLLSLTPLFTAKDGGHETDLMPIRIIGHTRAILHQRDERFGRTSAHTGGMAPFTTIEYRGTKTAPVHYHTRIPYEAWMEECTLSLETKIQGCAECEGASSRQVLLTDLFKKPQYTVPHYTAAYIMPKAEPVKSRTDRYSATVNFKVNQDRLEATYMNNGEILRDIREKVATVAKNEDISIHEITVVGYTSPEASQAYNKDLARRRAQTIADYLVDEFGIPRSKMKVSGYGEDWTETRKVVANSSLPDKSEVLSIIDRISDPDARDAHLRKLSRGKTYATMLQDLYPRIRRTEYSLSYVVAGFDVEKAKKIFAKNPKLLSLNEMYLVANTYPIDSEEFREVFRVSQVLFPEEHVAIINAAATLVDAGNYDDALKMLLKIKDDPDAWNNIAIAYALKGEYKEAMAYFKILDPKATGIERENVDMFYQVIKERNITL